MKNEEKSIIIIIGEKYLLKFDILAYKSKNLCWLYNFDSILIWSIACIYLEIDKKYFANIEIEVRSSTSKFSWFYRHGVSLNLNFEINISEINFKLKTSVINKKQAWRLASFFVVIKYSRFL